MLQESDIIPYHCSPPVGEKILVLAPHPDDETLGCGGTISLLVKSKKQVKVVFLTSGDKADPSHPLSKILHREHLPMPALIKEAEGESLNESHSTEYALLREKEAIRALKVLCVSDFEFLRFPDRELHTWYQHTFDRVLSIMRSYAPDTLYSPSPLELNPDHRTTARLAMEMHKQMVCSGMSANLIFYEVTMPLRPNLLIDISSVYGRKKQAIKKYKSQLKLKNYLRLITSLNIFRTLTMEGAEHAEAFWLHRNPLNSEDFCREIGYSEK
jgi:LmbE family N-acetylglucosaminyl deacetylase